MKRDYEIRTIRVAMQKQRCIKCGREAPLELRGQNVIIHERDDLQESLVGHTRFDFVTGGEIAEPGWSDWYGGYSGRHCPQCVTLIKKTIYG